MRLWSPGVTLYCDHLILASLGVPVAPGTPLLCSLAGVVQGSEVPPHAGA